MTSKNTKRFEDVRPGEVLPELAVPITVTLINGGAIATRDYFPGHHDAEAARALGSPHVFMNILTTNGLVQRFIEQWAGPLAQFTAPSLIFSEAKRASGPAQPSTYRCTSPLVVRMFMKMCGEPRA